MSLQVVVALLAMAMGAALGDGGASNNITTTTIFETTTITTTVHATTTPAASTSTQPSETTTEAPPHATVEVSAQLSVDNCQSFTSQPGVKEALAEGMASAAGGAVTAADMEVTLQCSRRLSSLGGRRLAEACGVVYRITVEGATSLSSPAVTAIVAAISAETKAGLAEKIKAAMAKRGIASGSLSVASIASPTATMPGATTTTPAPAGSSGDGEVSASGPRAACAGVAAALAAILPIAISA